MEGWVSGLGAGVWEGGLGGYLLCVCGAVIVKAL